MAASSHERAATAALLARVIDAVDGPGFGAALLDWLAAVSRADHVAAYAIDGEGARLVAAASGDGSPTAARNGARFAAGAFWRADPTFARAMRGPAEPAAALAHVSAAEIADATLRRDFYLRPRVREKVLVWRRRGADLLAVSVFRGVDGAPFSARDTGALSDAAELLLALCGRHAAPSPARVLASVPALEARLRAWPESLPPREVQALARLLHGLSVEGAALDMGVGAETLVTYRKRAFARLGLGSRQELLERFLERLAAHGTSVAGSADQNAHAAAGAKLPCGSWATSRRQ